ncbi:hypothetical protein GQ55_8G075000 [Panicum hallii var. hallii]|uniref:Uncharacterized protein n=1 Tax=Panicum hallii var. hallii TaxID=1504633 RepID=A0A2T7CLP8_9POAL|nr:hypothetical protein GQ55_8G075000 [Panicum hallii var. hallii]
MGQPNPDAPRSDARPRCRHCPQNLYSNLGKEVPASLKTRLAALTTNLPTSPSHAGDDMEDEDYMEEEDLEDLDGKDLNENDSDCEDMDGHDWDGEDRHQETDGDAENIGSNNGGSIINEFSDFCNEHDMW